jgi:protein-disulfide isomerase
VVSAPPNTLALVNGQAITVADLDPAVAQEVVNLQPKIAQARLQILEIQINTLLLDLESKKRKLDQEGLFEAEVVKRITDPSEAEIKQFIEGNSDQITEPDPQKLRTQVVAYLRHEREQKLSDEFVHRLRAANSVVPGVDINGPNVSPTAVVATVGGQPLTAASLGERLKPIIFRMQMGTFQIEWVSLNRTIDDVLLIAEANKRNVGPEVIIRTEITEKQHHPTPAEIAKFYNDNKAKITGDLPAVSNDIAVFLEQQEHAKLEQALSDRLRKPAQIQVFLTEPVQPVQTVGIEGHPSRGDVNARVTLVEFTDFECPSCAAMQPVLDEVLKSYGDRVRFVVRNFPLTKHAHARKAAEAANAAQAQGKFFEYTSLLFKRQNALDVPSLKKYATEVGLDRVKFDAALDGGTYAAAVRRDLDDGGIFGIDSTPTIFINGVELLDVSAEGLRAAIDKALAGPGAR